LMALTNAVANLPGALTSAPIFPLTSFTSRDPAFATFRFRDSTEAKFLSFLSSRSPQCTRRPRQCQGKVRHVVRWVHAEHVFVPVGEKLYAQRLYLLMGAVIVRLALVDDVEEVA
jgi:hypothetical protein